jgi:hypothetical protein
MATSLLLAPAVAEADAAAAGAAAAAVADADWSRGASDRCRIDACNQLLGSHCRAVALHDFDQHTGGGRGDFEHHLVGFDLNQDFIDGDGFAGLLLPVEHGGFRHGFGELRNFDFYDSHINLSEFL